MKPNYDERLCRVGENICATYPFFLRIEKRESTDTRHMLAAVEDGPLSVISVMGNSIVIEHPDRKLERVNRYRFTLTAYSLNHDVAPRIIAPIKDQELFPVAFLTLKEADFQEVVSPPDRPLLIKLGGLKSSSNYNSRVTSAYTMIGASNCHPGAPDWIALLSSAG